MLASQVPRSSQIACIETLLAFLLLDAGGLFGPFLNVFKLGSRHDGAKRLIASLFSWNSDWWSWKTDNLPRHFLVADKTRTSPYLINYNPKDSWTWGARIRKYRTQVNQQQHGPDTTKWNKIILQSHWQIMCRKWPMCLYILVATFIIFQQHAIKLTTYLYNLFMTSNKWASIYIFSNYECFTICASVFLY